MPSDLQLYFAKVPREWIAELNEDYVEIEIPKGVDVTGFYIESLKTIFQDISISRHISFSGMYKPSEYVITLYFRDKKDHTTLLLANN